MLGGIVGLVTSGFSGTFTSDGLRIKCLAVHEQLHPATSRKVDIDLKAYSGDGREVAKANRIRSGQSFAEAMRGDSAVPVGAGLNTPIMKQSFPSKVQLKGTCSKTSGATAVKPSMLQLLVVKNSDSRKMVKFNLGLGTGK
ncbi:hypothetical protein QYF36_018012 [Acer negundo]|nr:hypothetical protein QYF36_018012 [Acer negundo]